MSSLAQRARLDADRAVRSRRPAGRRVVRRRIGTSIAIVFTLKPLKALTPKGFEVVVGVLGGRLHRERRAEARDAVGVLDPQVDRVEHGAEVDREGLGALAGEDADAGRRVGEDALRRQVARSSGVVRGPMLEGTVGSSVPAEERSVRVQRLRNPRGDPAVAQLRHRGSAGCSRGPAAPAPSSAVTGARPRGG